MTVICYCGRVGDFYYYYYSMVIDFRLARGRETERRAFCAFECVYCSGECEIVLWRHNPYEDKSEVIICSHPVSVVGVTQNILCFCSFYCCCCVEMFRGVSNLPQFAILPKICLRFLYTYAMAWWVFANSQTALIYLHIHII